MFTPEKLIKSAKSIGSPQISGSGAHIVYTLGYIEGDKNRSHLWVMDSNGENNRQLTWDDASVSSPIWSPDDEQIAFVTSRDETHEIQVLSMHGGNAHTLVSHPNQPRGLAWNPDGTRIAYSLKVDPNQARESSDKKLSTPIQATTRLDYKFDGRGYLYESRNHLHVLDVESGSTRQLSSAIKDHEHPLWSPDGSQIAVKVTEQNGHVSRLHIFPLAGGDPTEIGWPKGSIGVCSWSPDQSQILFSGNPTPSPQLEMYRYITATGEVVQSTEGLDFSPESGYPSASQPSQPVWIDDDKVVINASYQGMTSLFGLDVTDGVDVQITIWEARQSGLSMDRSHTTLVQVQSSPETPGRLVKFDLKSHTLTTLLDPNADDFPVESLPQVERISVDRGDYQIDAWVYLPPNFDESGSYPVVLNVHGGPHNHHGFHWNTVSQTMAAAGNIVISPNPRGSGSYGREFGEAVHGDWGGEDWLDDLATLDKVLERPYADADRCGIFGYSYGGYIASWAIGHTDRFKAAIVGAPVYNFYSFAGTSDIGYNWCKIQWKGDVFDPAQAPAILERSPHTYIRNATTPTLILQGENDLRCPIGQAEELFVHLKTQGVETELVRYPECAHGMQSSGPLQYRIDFYDRINAWFAKYL